MSDLTIYAEALISTIARAFYEDDVVCIIDVLLKDKFLRDDDMSPRLNLPSKRLRTILQFLYEEHIVRTETVDDLNQGGSQATKFYYIDYSHAVHSIRLRIYLLQKQLYQNELHARSQSYYLCPGYNSKRCNGRYTEEEAQRCIDPISCLFVCYECSTMYKNNPNPPPIETYTLTLVDNAKELKVAIDNVRRLNVQFSSKFIGNIQLRPSIYDLLQKVRGGGSSGSSNNNNNNNNSKSSKSNIGKGGRSGSDNSNNNSNNKSNKAITLLPITSNLPSENFALGIGSKRLAGTGRTAGIKEKKLLLQGVAQSAAQARNYLVGSSSSSNNNSNPTPSSTTGGDKDDDNDHDDDNDSDNDDDNVNSSNVGGTRVYESDLLFLKNAMGNEIQFTIERGGAARAQLLVKSSFGSGGSDDNNNNNNKTPTTSGSTSNNNYNNNSTTNSYYRRKLMEAAASRVGSSLPIHVRVMLEQERKRKRILKNKLRKQQQQQHGSNSNNKSTSTKSNKKSKLIQLGDSFDFLKDNIGRGTVISQEEEDDDDEKVPYDNDDNDETIMMKMESNGDVIDPTNELSSLLVLVDDTKELQTLSDEKRLILFQKAYTIEMERQEQLLQLQQQQQQQQKEQETNPPSLGSSTTGIGSINCANGKKNQQQYHLVTNSNSFNDDPTNNSNSNAITTGSMLSPPPNLVWEDGDEVEEDEV